MGFIDSLKRIKIVGFSFGGQIAGLLSRKLFFHTNETIDMILVNDCHKINAFCEH